VKLNEKKTILLASLGGASGLIGEAIGAVMGDDFAAARNTIIELIGDLTRIDLALEATLETRVGGENVSGETKRKGSGE